LAADTPQSLGIIQNFLAHIILGVQLFFYSFVFGMNLYQIHFSASKHKQKLRLAANTPQSLEITELSGAHYLRSLVLFLSFSFWDKNISDTLFSIQSYSEAEIGS
jgi:hypothetical protein